MTDQITLTLNRIDVVRILTALQVVTPSGGGSDLNSLYHLISVATGVEGDHDLLLRQYCRNVIEEFAQYADDDELREKMLRTLDA